MKLNVSPLPLALCVYMAWLGCGVEAKQPQKEWIKTNVAGCTEENFRKAELLNARLIGLGRHGRPFPTNYEETKEFCKESTQLLERQNAFFKKCLHTQGRNMMNLLVYSIRNSIRQFCKKKSRKLTQLLQAIPCYNEHMRAEPVCLNEYINVTKQLIPLDHKHDKIKIPHVCCNYETLFKCERNEMSKYECFRGNEDRIADFIRGVFENIVEVICGEYNQQTDKCDKLSQAPKPSKPNLKHYPAISTLLIEVIESIEEA